MPIGALIGFLISNGPNLIKAGMDIAGATADLIAIIRGKPDGSQMTRDEFNAFIDKHVPTEARIQVHIDAALRDLEPPP